MKEGLVPQASKIKLPSEYQTSVAAKCPMLERFHFLNTIGNPG